MVLEIPEESGDLSSDELAYRVKIHGELFKMYDKEESYWHQRVIIETGYLNGI